ncbi:hypothetical protein [Paraflavitalea pollutisoli]|uniref:hypothetical protein n=1 Tax=Paraflavitalea pollutisoli TaxID=3034143 RepID=UPI0023EB7C6E|nr:hypothetical protein [Paraflavitalea sp. H1-2-19X]
MSLLQPQLGPLFFFLLFGIGLLLLVGFIGYKLGYRSGKRDGELAQQLAQRQKP